MKKYFKYLLMVIPLGLAPYSNADDLGISVILEKEIAPGVYGRVELGNDSRPELYYPQPTIIVKDSKYARYRPVYLHVPPGHAKHWDKHCHKYNACGRPVYFIRSAEYDTYDDHEHHQHDKKKHQTKGKEKHHGKH
jgi:hypothetical protein